MGGMTFALDQLNPAMREQAERKLAAERVRKALIPADKLDKPTKPNVPNKKAVANKYNARRIEADGIFFDSHHEYREYTKLFLRMRAGEITGLRCHVKFALFDVGGACRGELIGTYKADFVYFEDGAMVVADAKSEKTRTLHGWGRTKKLMWMCHQIEVIELQRSTVNK